MRSRELLLGTSLALGAADRGGDDDPSPGAGSGET